MIVYGDPQFATSLSQFAAGLSRRIHSANLESFEALRAILIQCGQLEQAIADLAGDSEKRADALAQQVTDAIAAAFYSALASSNTELPQLRQRVDWRAAAEGALSRLRQAGEMPLCVKVPEGFEFYSLFPEQYCAAAALWASQHAAEKSKRVLVVGIRSIGTSLSALVRVTLAARGWDAARLTVRPQGHPFQREFAFAAGQVNCASAIVVDEGPGISGSSMASVASALRMSGVQTVSFLPGNDREPGSAASMAVRHCWEITPRVVAPLETLRWNGSSLHQSFCSKTAEICKTNEPVELLDLSGGRWRQFAYRDPGEWPAIAAQFERQKFLCRTDSGVSVLWKFIGLGSATGPSEIAAEMAFAQLCDRAARGWAPEPLALFRGFVALPWIEGTRLGLPDATHFAPLLADYIAGAAGAELSRAELSIAMARLGEMLFWNSRELLGESPAERARDLAGAVEAFCAFPCFGDGRLAPWKWIRAREGAILKLDALAHTVDHTVVGTQPVLWDIAGALVEWDMDARCSSEFLKSLAARKIVVDARALRFYCASYAAFRAGQARLCAQLTNDPAEQQRLCSSSEYYIHHLTRQLAQK